MKIPKIIRILFYIAVISAALLFPEVKEDLPDLCAFARMGFLCPSCGFTRSLSSFVRFNFADSFGYNPIMCLVLAPAFFGAALQDTFLIIARCFGKFKNTPSFIESFTKFI